MRDLSLILLPLLIGIIGTIVGKKAKLPDWLVVTILTLGAIGAVPLYLKMWGY